MAAQRDPCSRVIRSSDAAGSVADECVAEPIEVRLAPLRGSDGLCRSDGFAARSEPGAQLEDGCAGVCGCGHCLDNAAFIPHLIRRLFAPASPKRQINICNFKSSLGFDRMWRLWPGRTSN